MNQPTYRLLSVNPFPAVCDACGRECPDRHLVVADQTTGTTRKLGTTCASTLTGVKATDRVEPVEVETTAAERAESADAMLSWMNE